MRVSESLCSEKEIITVLFSLVSNHCKQWGQTLKDCVIAVADDLVKRKLQGSGL